MCKIQREIVDFFKVDLNLDSYLDRQKELIISESFKETYKDKDPKLLLNKKELKQLYEKSKMINEKIKWIFFEKKVVVDFGIYLLRMSIRQEENKYYIHNIFTSKV